VLAGLTVYAVPQVLAATAPLGSVARYWRRCDPCSLLGIIRFGLIRLLEVA
jgi:uncharacterized membrane protein YadS